MRSQIRSLLLSLLALANSASAQLQLAPLSTFGTNGDGTIRPGDFGYPFLTGDGNRYQRGMAFNPATGHLIIVNRFPLGAETINVIEALTGTNVGTLDVSSPAIGGSASFVYNMIGVAEDGAIYVGNLTTSSSSVQFNLYRWASETDPQTLVYAVGNPGSVTTGGNTRWGDTLAVRGSGTSTEVLLAAQSGTYAAILRPDDSSMAHFSSTPLVTDVPAGGIGDGLAFGSGSTFYGKGSSSAGGPLYLLSYNLGAGTASTLHVYGTESFPGRVAPLAVLPLSNWLAGVEMTAGTAPDLVRLYDITATANSPVLLDRKVVETMTNANSVFAGSAAFGFGTNIYALNSDNGLVAYTIASGTDLLAARVFTDPQSLVVQLTSNAVFKVGADGTAPLGYQWRFNGTGIANATTAQYSIASAQLTNIGSYSVVVTNDYGSATSAVATLYVLASFGNTLVYEPFNYAAGSLLDGQGGWVLNSGGHFTNEAGSLSIPYLAPASSNHVVLRLNGTTRKPFGSYTNGALYFSFAMKLDNVSATASETTAAMSIGTTTTYSPKVNVTGDGAGHYTIGVYKGGGTTAGALATNSLGNTLLFTTSDTVFIVARYQFNPGTADDTCDLWVNPDPSTFGAATAPIPSVGPIGAGATDMTTIDRFVLRYSSGYPGRHFDEVRVGFDWAGVTPPANPVLAISQAGANAKLMWPTNISSGYSLRGIKGFTDPDGWQPVDTAVVVEGVSNTVTVPIGGSIKLFRLKK